MCERKIPHRLDVKEFPSVFSLEFSSSIDLHAAPLLNSSTLQQSSQSIYRLKFHKLSGFPIFSSTRNFPQLWRNIKYKN